MSSRARILAVLSTVAIPLALMVALSAAQGATELTPIEELGKAIFFDESLSINANQSCASCHAPEVGWVGPNSDINSNGSVYEGSISGQFGNRKPPSSAYATQAPIFHMPSEGFYVGGNFWDGRATGAKLGNPAADQAQGPFLNPKEQALASASEVVTRVCTASYGDLFRSVWGAEACDPANVDAAYDNIALSIAAYEGSPEVNAFTSKFDAKKAGLVKFDREEQRGFALFKGKAKCAKCHTANGEQPLFTDYTYDNLGMPANPANPVYDYDPDFVDLGLGGYLASLCSTEECAEEAAENNGQFKVPTLRNVDLRPPGVVKAYGHNGYFKSLEEIVHFYNTRDVLDVCPDEPAPSEVGVTCWPAAEYPEGVNTAELGNLRLTPDQEAALVAFMKTLSDGYVIPAP